MCQRAMCAATVGAVTPYERVEMNIESAGAQAIDAPSGGAFRRGVVALIGALPGPLARSIFWSFSVWDGGTSAVLKHPGSWRALEPFYTLPRRRGSICERLWGWALDNSRALPERLDIVVKEITSEVRLRALQGSMPVKVLSIGSGSARPVLEAAAALEKDVELMLLDIDADALAYSETLAAELHVKPTTRFVGNVLRLSRAPEREVRGFRPDIVELVGLLDYLNDRLALLMLTRIARFMPPGSVLLVGNVRPNHEEQFFDKALKWPSMVYRERDDFVALVERAGFAIERTRTDSYGIHTVLKARRLAVAQGAAQAAA